MNKSWSPRFLRKGKCHGNPKLNGSESSSKQTINSEIVLYETDLLSVQSPSQNAMKKSWSTRFLWKWKTHDNHEVKEKESENAVKKTPRFLRKEKSHEEGEPTERSTVSTGKQGGIGTGSPIASLGGANKRRSAICAVLMPPEYFQSIPYLKLLSVLSGTDLV